MDFVFRNREKERFCELRSSDIELPFYPCNEDDVVKNTEEQRKRIRRFQNRTDCQTERPTDRNNVTNCG